MKRLALYFTAPYCVSVQEESLGSPAAAQVMVQTLVSAISPGTELLFYRGQVPPDLPVDETIAALAGAVGFPLKYGYAAVGRVVAVGAQVAPEWHNRLVFSFHPHESHFLAALDELMPVPASVSAEAAVFVPNMETAVNFLMDGQPLIGEQVVIFGQGIVGLLTAALLARLPLASLVTLDHYPLRRETSLALGAHASLDAAEPHGLTRLHALLPQRADLPYEFSAHPPAFDQAI